MQSEPAPTAPTPTGRLCSLCGAATARFGPGPGGKRLDASCPRCGSLERHRFLALVASGLARSSEGGVLLDVAPMQATSDLLRSLNPAGYLSIDFDPAADDRAVDVAASLTQLPLPDGCVSLAVCMHVLEHIPDDAAAMSEVARTLAPSGVAVIQVPWKPWVPTTDEDPSAPVDARIERFGQADHVRYYGADFDDRLRAAGLTIAHVTPADLLDAETISLLGLMGGEVFWLCTRTDDAAEAAADPAGRMRSAVVGGLVAVLGRAATAAVQAPGPRAGSGRTAAAASGSGASDRAAAAVAALRVQRRRTARWVRRQPATRWAVRVTKPLRGGR